MKVILALINKYFSRDALDIHKSLLGALLMHSVSLLYKLITLTSEVIWGVSDHHIDLLPQ